MMVDTDMRKNNMLFYIEIKERHRLCNIYFLSNLCGVSITCMETFMVIFAFYGSYDNLMFGTSQWFLSQRKLIYVVFDYLI